MQVVVAGTVSLPESIRLGAPTQHPVASAGRDPPELLHVQVQQIAGTGSLVADWNPGGAVETGELAHPVSAEHPVDRGSRAPELGGQPVRTVLGLSTSPQDLPLGLGRQGMGTAARSA